MHKLFASSFKEHLSSLHLVLASFLFCLYGPVSNRETFNKSKQLRSIRTGNTESLATDKGVFFKKKKFIIQEKEVVAVKLTANIQIFVSAL